jgi:hypothetical protein
VLYLLHRVNKLVVTSVCSNSKDIGTVGDIDDDVRIAKFILIGARPYMLVYIHVYDGGSVE